MIKLIKLFRGFRCKLPDKNGAKANSDNVDGADGKILTCAVTYSHQFESDGGGKKKDGCRHRRTWRPPPCCNFFEAVGWSTAALIGLQYVLSQKKCPLRWKSGPEGQQKQRTDFLSLLRLAKIHSPIASTFHIIPPSEGYSNASLSDEHFCNATGNALQYSDDTHFGPGDNHFHSFETVPLGSSATRPQPATNGSKTPRAGETEGIHATLETERKAAEACMANIHNDVAMQYAARQDFPQALAYFEAGCEQGCARACFNAGVYHETGLGTQKDAKKAQDFYRRAGEKNHLQALYNLGIYYMEGRADVRDPDEAARLFERAAKGGLKQAQTALALWHFEHERKHEAVPWLVAAADQHDEEAQYHLGLCHEHGWGVEADMVLAAECYEQAAQRDHSAALHRLGKFSERGLGGIQQDLLAALRLYRRAEKTGDINARQSIAAVKSKLSLESLSSVTENGWTLPRSFSALHGSISSPDLKSFPIESAFSKSFSLAAHLNILYNASHPDGGSRHPDEWTSPFSSGVSQGVTNVNNLLSV